MRPQQRNFRERIFGFEVHFSSYPEFISLFQEIFIEKAYYFEDPINPPTIIDCGSNIGISVLYFKIIYPNSRILAFEPEGNNFQLLKKNVETNQLKNVECLNLAFSSTEGNATLFRLMDLPSLNWTTIKPIGKYFSQEIRLAKLSDYLMDSVSMIKIDVEGSEELIIDDLIQSKKIHLVSNLIIECHEKLIEKSSQKLIAKLKHYGYSSRQVGMSGGIIVATKK
jgi:FkbM family methyltransferase